MNSRTFNYGLKGLLISLILVFIYCTYLANLLPEHKSVQIAKLAAKVKALDNQETQLNQDKKDISTYAGLNMIAESVVPQDKNQAETVQEIVNLAAQSGIAQLSSITFPPSSLGGASINTPNGLTQVTPVTGIHGVYDLEITIAQGSTSRVPYSNFIAFLTKLEQNRRTALVNSIAVEPDPTNTSMVAFTIVVNEYIKP